MNEYICGTLESRNFFQNIFKLLYFPLLICVEEGREGKGRMLYMKMQVFSIVIK